MQTKKDSIIVTMSKHLLLTNLKKKIAKNFYNKNTKKQNHYYMTNENLNYYESKNHDEIVVNFITSIVIKTFCC